MDEVLLVQRHQNELVRGGNRCDLPVDERSRPTAALKSRPLVSVPGGRRFVIGQDWKGCRHDVLEVGIHGPTTRTLRR